MMGDFHTPTEWWNGYRMVVANPPDTVVVVKEKKKKKKNAAVIDVARAMSGRRKTKD